MTTVIGRAQIFLLMMLSIQSLYASIEPLQFSSDDLRERYQYLVDELRCPKCQNQNLADSNSPIAADLRREVYRMLNEGKTNDEIAEFMVQRYGEFVLYRPMLTLNTLLLWLGPAIFLLMGFSVLLILQRRRRSHAQASLAVAPLTEQQRNLLRELHGSDAITKRDL